MNPMEGNGKEKDISLGENICSHKGTTKHLSEITGVKCE